ncbi:hypothetical protein HaLaN_03818, partial [Haematococcus lacustris]
MKLLRERSTRLNNASELSPNDKWNDEKSTADVKSEEALNVAYHADPLLQHNLWVQEHSAPA